MKKMVAAVLGIVMIAGWGLTAFASIRHTDEARAVLEYVNDERRAAGLSALSWESSLVDFAYIRANEIITHWSHTRPNGQDATDYTSSDGVRVNGENLANGTIYTAAEVVDGWMNSPTHRDNILKAEYTSMAVACVEEVQMVEGYGDVSFYYWVQLFHTSGSGSGGGSDDSIGGNPGEQSWDNGYYIETSRPSDSSSSRSDGSSSGRGGASSASTASPKAAVSGTVESKSAVEAVKRNGSFTVQNKESVTPAVLKEMAQASSGATLVAKTYCSDTPAKVQGQITIPASGFAEMKNSIQLGVYTEAEKVGTVLKRMDKWYSNNVAVVRMEQTGALPVSVKIAAKVELAGLDTEFLQFYAYDSKQNTIHQVEKPDYRIDKNGFLHFNTDRGGYIIITDKALTK